MTNRLLALAQLRAQARAATLGPPSTLEGALHRIGFVQADPIRAPARAQDLILRHRVRGYRAGDLDRAFQRLGLEENFLYAYGFIPAETRHLLHPRTNPADEASLYRPDTLAAVLEFMRAAGPPTPGTWKRVSAEIAPSTAGAASPRRPRGRWKACNYGLLRIARRQDGIRIYAAAPEPPSLLEAAGRARQAVLLVAWILAPVSWRSLGGALPLKARRNLGLGLLTPVVHALLKAGALEQDTVEGERHLWPGRYGKGALPAYAAALGRRGDRLR